METPNYTRNQLIAICEAAIVEEPKWEDRDSADSQMKVGSAWALLRAGCGFKVIYKPESSDDGCVTDKDTIWLRISIEGFSFFEGGSKDEEIFYLPTPERLLEKKGADWY